MWGVKNYTIEVWDATTQQWRKIIDENKDRTMKNRVHRLGKPVRAEASLDRLLDDIHAEIDRDTCPPNVPPS